MKFNFNLEDVNVPPFESVPEFTGPQKNQLYGGVQEVPLKAKIQRWGIELLFAHTLSYTGKILFRKGDPQYRGRVQYHTEKDETFYVLSGRCILRWDTGNGELTEKEVGAGYSFHVPRYARHSIIALTDCIFLEVSSPSFEDRQNVDEDYVTREYLKGDPTFDGTDEAGVEAAQRRIDESSPVLVEAVLEAIVGEDD